MGFHKNKDPRYELLHENRSFNPTILQNRVNTIWVAFCVIGLIVTFITAVVYLTCFSESCTETFSSSKLIEMDFVIFGPQKVIKGDYKALKHRAEQYALSSYNNMNSTKWNGETSIRNLALDQKFKYITKKYSLVCYYTLPKNTTTGQLLPSDLDPNLCTHINLAFAYIDQWTIKPESEADIMAYSQVIDLKQKNPSLKVLISVMCNEDSGRGLLNVIDTAHSRKKFISNMIRFLDKHRLDGIDFDWEFPSWPDVNIDQKNKFANLLDDIKLAFNKIDRGQGRYILSAAVAAPGSIIDQAYNVSRMASAVDYINLMAYDYHYWTSYLPVTGPNAPLYQGANEYDYFATLNGNWSIDKWIQEGMPPHKIVLGVPTYGHTFELYNPANHHFNSPASGFGSIGFKGFASYADVCKFLTDPDVDTIFDHDTRTPYAFRNKEWISFDDVESMGYKASHVTERGLGGIMVWALNLDDYDGICDGETSFPLIKRLNKTLNDDFL